jgi:hypothetical protein
MKRNHLLIAITAALAIALFTYGCKTMGMAGTTRGQLFKININAPENLPEGATDNVDIVLSNRGVNNMRDILVDVELPPQLVVLDQTNDRGIDAVHVPGSNVYHFTIPRLNPAEDAHIRYRVRTTFGPATEAVIAVTAWQKDLPNDKLFRKTVIKLRT